MKGASESVLRDAKDGFAIYQLKDAPELRGLRFASLAELRAAARQMRSRVHAVVGKAENMVFGSKADAEQFLRTEGFTVVPSEEPDVIFVLSPTRMSANICLDYGVDCCLVEGCDTRGLDQPVSRENYLLTYAGSLPDSVLHLGQPEAMLESLFSRFNTERPQDFQGHSLSVSDVIALKLDGQVTCYYTDSFGFEKLPDFLSRDELSRENYLRNTEMLLEDDYNMLDGIVNNGPREGASQAPEKQKPVSDRDTTDTPHTHSKALASKEPERKKGEEIMENNMNNPAPAQERNEITIKFGRGLVSAPFTARTGRECVSIKIPHADPADKTPWPSIIVAANHVHENRFGKGMWMKLPADGETKLYVPEVTGQTPEGRNVYKNTVVKLPNAEIKAMLESYRERPAEATRAAAPDKVQPRKSHGMER